MSQCESSIHFQLFKMACLEEIDYRKGWLSRERLAAEAKLLGKTLYGQYLSQLIVEK